jgi:hypothetical protein
MEVLGMLPEMVVMVAVMVCMQGSRCARGKQV